MQVRNDDVLVMAACVSVPWCFLSDSLSVGECRESLSPSGLPEHLITCIWPDCRHTCHPSAHHPSSASSPTDGTSSPAASITCPALPDSAILQSSSTFVIRSPSLPSSLCFGNKSLKPHIGHQATESFWAPLLKRNISGPLLQEIFSNSTSLRFNYFAFCQVHLGSLTCSEEGFSRNVTNCLLLQEITVWIRWLIWSWNMNWGDSGPWTETEQVREKWPLTSSTKSLLGI